MKQKEAKVENSAQEIEEIKVSRLFNLTARDRGNPLNQVKKVQPPKLKSIPAEEFNFATQDLLKTQIPKKTVVNFKEKA